MAAQRLLRRAGHASAFAMMMSDIAEAGGVETPYFRLLQLSVD
jgi:hypothetical protein